MLPEWAQEAVTVAVGLFVFSFGVITGRHLV